MKIKTQTKRKRIALLSTVLATTMAYNNVIAVPWCHGGTIVQISDVTWNESSIVSNYPGSIPGDIPLWVVGNVNMHITHESIQNYASTFVGGGGGFGGYVAANSGQVIEDAYWPHNYITAPSLYHISQGVKFKLKKCFTIPPMTAVKDLAEIALPFGANWGVLNPEYIQRLTIKPLDGLDYLGDYWLDSRANK